MRFCVTAIECEPLRANHATTRAATVQTPMPRPPPGQLAVNCLRIAVALIRWWLGLAFGSSPYEQDHADYDQPDPVKDVRPEGGLVGPEVSANQQCQRNNDARPANPGGKYTLVCNELIPVNSRKPPIAIHWVAKVKFPRSNNVRLISGLNPSSTLKMAIDQNRIAIRPTTATIWPNAIAVVDRYLRPKGRSRQRRQMP